MKNLKIYDNGGETIDRYTIIDTEPSARPGTFDHETGTFSTHRDSFCFVGACETGSSFYQHGEIKAKHIGPHLGKLVSYDSLHINLKTRLMGEFDHRSLIYTGDEQLRAMVLFDDGSKEPFTIVTRGRNRNPDCMISSVKLNIYFRTKRGVEQKTYESLAKLKADVIRKMKSVLEKHVVSVDFALVDEVNLF